MKQDEIQLLIFTSGGQRYGIDIAQIACLANADAPAATVEFTQLIAAEQAVQSDYVKILIIKQLADVPILINEPDEVAIFSVADIRSVPSVLRVAAQEKGVWGMLPQECGSIILLDFHKNKQLKRLKRVLDLRAEREEEQSEQ